MKISKTKHAATGGIESLPAFSPAEKGSNSQNPNQKKNNKRKGDLDSSE